MTKGKLLVLTCIDPMTVTAMPQKQFLSDHNIGDLLGAVEGCNITLMVQQFGDYASVDDKKRIISESCKVGFEVNEHTTFDYLSIQSPPIFKDYERN